MAINYAVKYATKIAEAFSKPSITDDDAGKAYTWTGPNSKTIVVGSVDTDSAPPMIWATPSRR